MPSRSILEAQSERAYHEVLEEAKTEDERQSVFLMQVYVNEYIRSITSRKKVRHKRMDLSEAE
jgi:hypothetical protein